ncbi:hypothetical protein PhCBS80983_g06070 [Powellomyces hirtus]|uniref:Peptidase S59 domain-containing protein n=1 Tax=Powellomyces hirtus TaxID=109895 RepID=A0A507DR65_9FUNG|nr:hypothetical protein PhCBS80983_g06070 [Powellomyces hirtus]
MFSGFGGTGFGQQQQRPPQTGFGAAAPAFGQQQQQPQQPVFGAFGHTQQPQTGAFGAPASTFGQPSAFGGGATNTSGFGAQPTAGFGAAPSAFGAAPQTGTMFGAAPAATTGFGGFGAAASAAPAASGFGSALSGGFGAKPAASGFGGFGASAAPTIGFGAAAAPATGFGAPSTFGAAPTQSAFGGAGASSSGMFGGGGFGAAGAGAQTNDTINNGTGAPPFQAAVEEDQANNGVRSKNYLQHCSAMIAYRNWSPEELRWQDYQMNKKFAGAGSTATAGFGSTGFGATNTGFGAGAGGFGAPASTGFGATPATTAPALGLFGGGSTFGAQQQPQQSAFGFGQTPSTQAAGSSLFGQSAFGQATAPAFGQQSSAPSAFGQPKPAFGFGATPATTQSAFGMPSAGFGQTAATTSLFGSTPASSGLGFGATPALGQSAPTGFGSFPASSTAGGAFGAKPAFGFGAATTAPAQPFGATAAGGFGGFGGAAASTAPTQSLFGVQSQAQPAPSLFGSAPSFTGFGATPASGGFGAAQQPKPAFSFGAQSMAAPASSFGSFGQAPAPSFFGAQQPAAGGFGGPSNAFTGGLFNPGGGVTTAPLGFNSSLNAGQPTASLRASIDRNPYGINPIFESPAKKQEPALYPAPEEKRKLPMSPYTKVTAREASKIKLRGFSPPRLARSPHINGASRYESAIGKSKDDGTIGLDPRFTPRKNIRRLIIEEPTDGEVPASPHTKGRTPAKKGVTFDPELEREASRAIDDTPVDVYDEEYDDPASFRGSPSPGGNSFLGSSIGRRSVSPSMSSGPGTPTPQNRNVSKSASPSPAPRSPAAAAAAAAHLDDYILSPTLEHLLRMETEDLRAVKNFKISVPGIGSIHWLEPVDLIEASPTKNRSGLDQIAGNIVILAPKLATVYPDDTNKPPMGMGLNVRAEVALEKCWPVDKSTREFILDTTDPRHDRHMKKLEAMPDTEFQGYHNESGTWKFIVQHFSRYGLDDDDDEAEALPQHGSSASRISPSQNAAHSRKALTMEHNQDDNPFFDAAQVGSERGQTGLGYRSFSTPEVNDDSPLRRRGYGLSGINDDENQDEDDTGSELNDSMADHLNIIRISPSGVRRGSVSRRRWVDLAQDWNNESTEEEAMEDEEGQEDNATRLETAEREEEGSDEEDMVSDTRSDNQDSFLTDSDFQRSGSPRHDPGLSAPIPTRKQWNPQQLEVAHDVQRMKSSLFASPASGQQHQQASKGARLQKLVHFNLPSSDSSSPASGPDARSVLQDLAPCTKRTQKDSTFAGDYEDDLTTSTWRRSGFGLARDPEYTIDDNVHEADAPVTITSCGAPRSPKKYLKTVAKTLEPFEHSVAYGHDKAFLDPGLMMGRSCRVGWGPGGMLVVAGSSFAGVRSFSNVSIKKVNVFGTVDEDGVEIERLRHEKMLRAALDHSAIVKTVSGTELTGWECDLDGESSEGTPKVTNVPVATLISQLNFEAFVDVIIRTDELGRARAGDAHANVFSNVETLTWKLASALWDPLDITSSDGHDYLDGSLEQGLRRERISAWLKEAVKQQVVDEAKTRQGAKKIFTLLSGRQISKAVLSAMQDKDLRLASILAQLGGAGCRVVATSRKGLLNTGLAKSTGGHGITTRYGADARVVGALKSQIDVWAREEARSGGGLKEDYLMLWKLAAGNVQAWGSETFQGVSDWKRTFGLFLWYGSAGAGTVRQSLAAYQQGFTMVPVIAPPKPACLAANAATMLEEQQDGRNVPEDVCFHLLKLFAENEHLLETALHPLNVSPNELDHRVSWLLWMVLSTVKNVRSAADSRLEHIRISQARHGHTDMDMESDEGVAGSARSAGTADRLARDLMWQLETLGLWKWSIFVALFLGRKEGRERAVRDILAKYYPIDDDSDSWIMAIDDQDSDDDSNAMDTDGRVSYPSVTTPAAKVSDLWTFLVDHLKVPAIWIHEARALTAKYQGDVVQEAISLIDAKQYAAAHRVILMEIAPEDIINERYTELKLLLKQIPSSAIDAKTWVNGGKLLLKYIEVVERAPFVIRQARDYAAGYSLNCNTMFGRSVIGKSHNGTHHLFDDRDGGPDQSSVSLGDGDAAEAARIHACEQLRNIWIEKVKSILGDLANDEINNATAQHAKSKENASSSKTATPSWPSKSMTFVCRTEMAGRLVVLLLDCKKVLATTVEPGRQPIKGVTSFATTSESPCAKTDNSTFIDPVLLAELPLVPTRRSAVLHRLVDGGTGFSMLPVQ